MELPISILEFLDRISINKDWYKSQLLIKVPRYIRINSKLISCDNETISRLELDLKSPLTPTFISGFYSLPYSISLKQSVSYNQALIYGMDISSAVAVDALEISPTDHVLDLCCAPGAKLCYISEQLGPQGSVTGFDISKPRLFICKSLVRKYKCNNVRLFCSDGTCFQTNSPSRVGPHNLKNPKSSYIQCEKFNKPLYASKTLREKYQYEITNTDCLYDKVIVDAECKLFYIIKEALTMDQYTNSSGSSWTLDYEQLKKLKTLQKSLLLNGFKLLKPGGILVYSTCSFSVSQNEDIVSEFLEMNSNAVLEVVPNSINYPCAPSKLLKTIRFDPVNSNTSGFFLSRIRKIDTH